MAELRSKLTGDGYWDVATVLQSGNVIVSTEVDRPGEVAGAIRRLLRDEFDVDVACVVRTANQVRAVLERNPLQEVVSDPSRYLVTFLSQEPDPEAVEALVGEDHSPEAIAIEGAEAYVWTPDGVKAMTAVRMRTSRSGSASSPRRATGTPSRRSLPSCDRWPRDPRPEARLGRDVRSPSRSATSRPPTPTATSARATPQRSPSGATRPCRRSPSPTPKTAEPSCCPGSRRLDQRADAWEPSAFQALSECAGRFDAMARES